MNIAEFFKIRFGPFDMYEICMTTLMIIGYSSYTLIKNKNPKNVKYIPNIMIIVAIIYILINLFLGVRDQDVYIFSIPFIVVGLVIRNRAKHDLRGIKSLNIINSQKNWEKKEVYFFPKDFTNEELTKIENQLNNIFICIEETFGNDNVGGLFIWIKKKRQVNSIKIVNVLSLDDKWKLNKLECIYKKIAADNYGEVNIKEKITSNIELNIVV